MTKRKAAYLNLLVFVGSVLFISNLMAMSSEEQYMEQVISYQDVKKVN